MRDFSLAEGFKSGGILCVFPAFDTAQLGKKIHCSAAGDLFRGSLNYTMGFPRRKVPRGVPKKSGRVELARKILMESLNKSSAAVSGSFSSTLRYRKREIHTVFRRFRYLDWPKNLSLTALADLLQSFPNKNRVAKPQPI